MVDILHKVGIKSLSKHDVYKALTTIDGLAAWWTRDTQGEYKVGGVLKFRFGAGGFDMNILELRPEEHVLWRVVDSGRSSRAAHSKEAAWGAEPCIKPSPVELGAMCATNLMQGNRGLPPKKVWGFDIRACNYKLSRCRQVGIPLQLG